MKNQVLVLSSLMIFASHLGCKQKSLDSQSKIDQTANNTVTRLAQSALFKFNWKSLDSGSYSDGPIGVPEYSLTVSVCADHQGSNSCKFVDFKSGAYSSGYPYMTKIKVDNSDLNYAFEISGAEIERAASGKGSYKPGNLRALEKSEYKDYYLEVRLWEEDGISADDLVGWDCKYFEDIHTGSVFIINGEDSSRSVVEVASAGFDDTQVFPSLDERSKERSGCRD